MDLHAENRALTPVLQAGRFVLRPMGPGDIPAFVRVLNDWQVTRWLTRVPFPYAAADGQWFIDNMVADPDIRVWGIDAGDGLIGTIGVKPELGYWLDPAHHGRGIMTEAATMACDWFFAQGQDDLMSGYHLSNGPSRAVLTKLGFTKTQLQRNVTTARDESVDIQRMVLRRADWQARRG